MKQKWKQKWKQILCLAFLLTLPVSFTGCTLKENKLEKLRDLEFTVVSENCLPEELSEIITEKKIEEFKMTYFDKEYLYICVGYGEQESGGYSIGINELYLTENAIYFDSNLIGPSKEEAENKASSYPFIVVKLEAIDKTVVFD